MCAEFGGLEFLCLLVFFCALHSVTLQTSSAVGWVGVGRGIPTSCNALGSSLAVVHARHATLEAVMHGDGVGKGGADNVQLHLYSHVQPAANPPSDA